MGQYMDQIALKTANPKCRLFLKIDLAACVYLSEAPSPPRFLLGVVKDIVQPKKRGVWISIIRTVLTFYTIADGFFEHLKG